MRVTFTISFQFFVQLRDYQVSSYDIFQNIKPFTQAILFDSMHQEIRVSLMKYRPEISENSDKIKINIDVKHAVFILGMYQSNFPDSWKTDFKIIENALLEKYKNIIR